VRIARNGVTRLVVLAGPVAVKLPRLGNVVRGWLANRSEWHQRGRDDVARPWLSVGHIALVMPRADEVCDDEYRREPSDGEVGRDEAKGSSWGRFGDRWLLIDFDRSWEPPRGLVGSLYFGRQERTARRWMRLPVAR
jgi:hypothetical protein